MYQSIQLTNTSSSVQASNSRSLLRRGFLLITLGLAWFGLSPAVRAVTPAPDGGYGNWNTAEGQDALFRLTTGGFNTAIGGYALYGNFTGSANTAVGAFALAANNPGSQNVAVGQGALRNNITPGNVGVGYQALYHNTTGYSNTATGYQALYSNTDDGYLNNNKNNTANGYQALYANNGGGANTAMGSGALRYNTTGYNNTAIGFLALYNNTTGGQYPDSGNTAIGYDALTNNTSGSSNIALGDIAGGNVTTANNVICIGTGIYGANVDNSCFIGSIRGVTTQQNDAMPVLVDSAGQLGTASSSRRYKTDIKPIDKASESILALKPVSFRYKVHNDVTPQFGLIAEDVARVNPDLVIFDHDSKPYTVRYESINAMLLNEFLKEHRKVEEQSRKVQEEEATIAQLKSRVAQQQNDFQSSLAEQQKQIKALASGLEKVSAQLEVSKPAPQMVLNAQ